MRYSRAKLGVKVTGLLVIAASVAAVSFFPGAFKAHEASPRRESDQAVASTAPHGAGASLPGTTTSGHGSSNFVVAPTQAPPSSPNVDFYASESAPIGTTERRSGPSVLHGHRDDQGFVAEAGGRASHSFIGEAPEFAASADGVSRSLPADQPVPVAQRASTSHGAREPLIQPVADVPQALKTSTPKAIESMSLGTPMLDARHGHGSAFWNGWLYQVGGNAYRWDSPVFLSSVIRWNPSTNVQEYGPSLLVARSNSSAVVADGKLWALPGGNSNTTEYLDDPAGPWKSGPTLPLSTGSITRAKGATGSDGCIYFFVYPSGNFKLDPSMPSPTWEPISGPPQTHGNGMAVAAARDYIYVLGGLPTGGINDPATTRASRYHIPTQTWEIIQGMPIGRGLGDAVGIGCSVFYFSGASVANPRHGAQHDGCYFNSVTNSWTMMGGTARQNQGLEVGAASLPDGRIVVSGGFWHLVNSDTFEGHNTVYVYTPPDLPACPSTELDITGDGWMISSGTSTTTTDDGTDFGEVPLGSSQTNSFLLTNTGSLPLIFGESPGVNLTGSDAGSFSVVTPLPASLDAGLSFELQLKFQPSAVGWQEAMVNIESNDADENPYTFAVSGTGIAQPELKVAYQGVEIPSATPPSAALGTDFGDGGLGQEVTHHFELNNPGSAPLVFSDISLSGGEAARFSVHADSDSLDPGDSRELTVVYTPSAGSASASLIVTSNAANVPTYTLNLAGGYSSPELLVLGLDGITVLSGDDTPAEMDGTDFGEHVVGSRDAVTTFTIRNLASATYPLAISSIELVGQGEGQFALEVPFTGQLLPDDDFQFAVRYAPSSAGVHEAQLVIRSNDVLRSPYTFSIAGIGLEGPRSPLLVVYEGDRHLSTGDFVSFPQAGPGGTSTLRLAVADEGTAPLFIRTLELSGEQAGDFKILLRPPSVIGPNQRAPLVMSFDPSQAGVRSATLAIQTKDSTFSLELFGTGVGADYARLEVTDTFNAIIPNSEVSPGAPSIPLATGTLEQGDSAASSFRLWNKSFSPEPLSLNGDPIVEISGPSAAEFSVSGPFSTSIQGDSYVPFTVVGRPDGPGIRDAIVTIKSSDEAHSPWSFHVQVEGKQTREIAVFGNGLGIWDGDGTPSSADDTDFGDAEAIYGSVVRTFVIENVGDTNTYINLYDIPRVRVLGEGAESFAIVRQPGSPIAGGETSSFDVEFKPTSDGVHRAILSIANDDGNEDPFDFAILGRGVGEVAGSVVAGYTPGAFDVEESGAATYSIGVSVPPGTAGMQPSLSIDYQHRVPNGPLGVGFQLGGMSAITRGTRTLAQDGRIDDVKFNTDDQFFLDGQRLVLVSGTHGSNGAEYRTDKESFARVKIVGEQNGGPREFLVQTKSGQAIHYGSTEDSRIEAGGSSAVLAWALARVEDTVGNYLTWTYDEDNANGAYYPIKIDYTGNDGHGLTPYNSVIFRYDDRLDDLPRYLAGSLIRYAKRLSSIETYAEGNLVKRLALEYDQSPVSERSRITSVSEYAGDGSHLLPTTFIWSGEDTALMHEAIRDGTPGSDPSLSFVADFDGDGRSDFATANGAQVEIRFSRADGSSENRNLSTVDQWGATGTSYPTNGVADFDADGIADIWSVTSSQIRIRKTRPSTNSFAEEVFPQNSGITWALPGDYNADGRSDIAFLLPNSVQIWYSAIGTNGLQSYTIPAWPYSTVAEAAKSSRAMDVNGDGITDLVSNVNGSVYLRLARFASDGTPSFEGTTWSARENGGFVGDFNGDGLADLAIPGGFQTADPDNPVRRVVFMNLSTARGFALQDWDVQDVWGEEKHCKVADVNGDHLSDLVVVNPGSAAAVVLYSNGKAFRRVDVPLSQPWAGGELAIGDLNGDGLADIASQDGALVAPLCTTFPDQIVSITTGLGATTDIDYKPLTDPTVYTKQTGATYPDVDFQNALYVVATASQDDGRGGRYYVDYTYSGGIVNLQGRGFLGFKTVESKDRQTGLTSRTYFRRDYPFEGLAEKTEEVVGDKMVSRSTMTYDKTEYGADPNKRRFVYLKKKIDEAFEINQALPQTAVVRTTTDNTWDSTYGNLLTTTTEVRGGSSADRHWKTTKNIYENWVDANRWILGRLTRATVEHRSNGTPTITRASEFSYDATTGLLESETVEPDSAVVRLSTSYTRDDFGNIKTTTVSGGQGVSLVLPRTSTIVYETRGRFPSRTTNPLGQETSAVYDPRFGEVVEATDVNGHVTRNTLDSFGRLARTDRPDGTWTTRYYDFVADATRPELFYELHTETSSQPPATARMDILDREVETETVGFNGERLLARKEFNGKGQLVRQSKPFFLGDPIYWTTQEYDSIGRATKVTAPDGATVRTVYDGLSTTVYDAYNHPTASVRDSMNRIISVTDANGRAVTYKYDATDNLLEIRDPEGNISSNVYDIRGRRIQSTDPDMGTWTYVYDAAGNLKSQTDAKHQTKVMTYDAVDRLIQRSEPEGITTWVFDTATNGIGLVASVEQDHSPNAPYREYYEYDELSRPSSVIREIDGQNYTFVTTFDSYGRPDVVQYPDSFGRPFWVRNNYSPIGYPESVSNVQDGTVYWRAVTINASGQVTEETLGNGVQVNRDFDPETDRLLGIISGVPGGPELLQDLEYSWDLTANLMSRKDSRAGASNLEVFTYDSVNRLTTSRTGLIPSLWITKSFAYDDLGNIMSKSDVGTYVYTGGGPHQVMSISGGLAGSMSFGYDDNGNAVSWAGRAITWNSWNMASSVARGAVSSSFLYGPDRMRYKQVADGSDGAVTTTYIGTLFEKTEKPAETEDRYFVFAGGARVASLTRKSSAPESLETRYFLRDHLGSTDVVTDESGAPVERLSFDPWGQRRLADAASLWLDSSVPIIPTSTNRGFTDHEHLDELGLVNMNGRIYDPLIGRFLSADPVVQAMYNLQNLNRYSYVLNNPLSLTDPSGLFFKWVSHFIGHIVHSVVDFVKDNWRVIVSTAATFIAGPLAWAGFSLNALSVSGLTLAQAIGAGITGGFAGGFIGSGTLHGAILGAVQGGITAGIGVSIGKSLWAIPAHGVVSGAFSELRGGSFRSGFFAGAFAKMGGRIGFENFGGESLGDIASRTAIAATAGGVGAEFGGGKFKNGAASGAFIHILNGETTNWLMKSAQIAKQSGRGLLTWPSRILAGTSLAAGPGIAGGIQIGPFGVEGGYAELTGLRLTPQGIVGFEAEMESVAAGPFEIGIGDDGLSTGILGWSATDPVEGLLPGISYSFGVAVPLPVAFAVVQADVQVNLSEAIDPLGRRYWQH